MKKIMYPLNDGTSVSLDEFNSWHFNKQHAKTRPLAELQEIRKKVTLANQREVNTPFGIFKSVKDAVDKTGMSYGKLRGKLLNELETDYFYTKSKPADENKKINYVLKRENKVTVTPLGTFKSKSKAAEAHGLNKSTLGRLMTANPMEYYFLSEGPKEIVIVDKIRKETTRAVNTPFGTFHSINEAIIHTSLPYLRLRRYLLSTEHPEYSYVKTHSGNEKREPRIPTAEELDAMRIRRGMAHRRAVNTPKGQFETVREAINVLGITKDALRDLCLNTAYPLYSYVNPTKKDLAQQYHKVYKGGPKKTVTPIGTYATKGLAAKALGISYEDLDRMIKLQPKKYYYSEDNVNIGIRKAHNPALYHPTKGYRLPKEYMTPTGPYPSKLQACKDYGLSAIEFDYLMEKHPKDFYKMKK
jgi:hypothetical protein